MEVNELISCLDKKFNNKRHDNTSLSFEDISNGLAQAIVSGDESNKNLALRAAAELTTRIDESMKPVLLMLEELDAPLEAVLDNIDDSLKRGALENIIGNNNKDDKELNTFVEKSMLENGLVMSCKPIDLSFTFERLINRQLAFPCGFIEIIYEESFEIEPEYLLFIETNGEIALQIGPGILQHIEYHRSLWNSCLQASARSHSPCAMLAIAPLLRELLKQSSSFICQSRWAPPWERYGSYGSSALLSTICSWQNISMYLNATETALNYAFTPTPITTSTSISSSTASSTNDSIFNTTSSNISSLPSSSWEEVLKRRLGFMLLFVGYGSWFYATLIVAVQATNNKTSSNNNNNNNNSSNESIIDQNENQKRLVSSKVEACALRVLRRVLHDGGMTVGGSTEENTTTGVIGDHARVVDVNMFTDILDSLVTSAKEGDVERFQTIWMKAGSLGVHCLLLLMLATRVFLTSVTLIDSNNTNNDTNINDEVRNSYQTLCQEALDNYSCVCMRAARLDMAEHITTRCHLSIHVATAWLIDIARQFKLDSQCNFLGHLISSIHVSIWDTMVKQISVDSWFYMLLSFLGTDVKQELKKFEDITQQISFPISFCRNSHRNSTS